MARRSDHSREELKEMALEAAKRIIETEGLRGLSARRVAREIGYTIGTIYNVFTNLDDLVDHLNGQTLDALHEHCSHQNAQADAASRLRDLGRRFIEFAAANPKLYVTLFEHQHPAGKHPPVWYYEKVNALLQIVEASIQPVIPDAAPSRVEAEARVLWAGVHGIISLEGADRIGGSRQADDLVNLLVDNFLSAVR
ncbi:MAG: TetR/AcrR family transcriptional regulator [Pseudomonadota bacterium]